MADRIKGITIEIGGDTTGLSKALGGVNKEIKSTQSQLKDVERLLKLDPTNTNLLQQKQKLLAKSVEETRDKLKTLKDASEQAAKTKDNYDSWKAKYDPIKQKITETEAKLQEALRRRIGKGVTFVIAQRVSAIADADLILVMEDGVIVGQGTHKELIRSNEVYRGIVASQWGEEAIA